MMEKLPNYGEKRTFQVNMMSLLLFSFCFIWAFKRRVSNQFWKGGWKICFPSRFLMSLAFPPFFSLFFPPFGKMKFQNFSFDVWVGRNVTYFPIIHIFLLRKVKGNLFWQVEGYQTPFWHFHWQKKSCFLWDDEIFIPIQS